MVPRRLTDRAAQTLADAEAAQSALPPAPEAIRFRAQLTMFGVIATVASGLYVYSEKHAAASLDRQIAHAFQATLAAHQQSNLLRAEWALLNNPDRLHPLADRYLSLQPLNAAQFAKVTDLHSRLPHVLYGPLPPPGDDDAGAPSIVTRRLLAMAEMPAPALTPAEAAADTAPPGAPAEAVTDQVPDEAPGQPASTPVVAAPAHAYRVLAHAGALPALVDAGSPEVAVSHAGGEAGVGEAGGGESGVVEDEAPRPPAEMRQTRPVLQPLPRQAPRPAAPLFVQNAAPKLAAHVEPPKSRLFHTPAALRPELVHMLMMPHPLYTSTWTPAPKSPMPMARAMAPQHHVEYGRSEPPHFLSVSPNTPVRPAEPQQYAEARPRVIEQPRQETWTPPVTYRAPPPYMYRPYWGGYNTNPYGGYYYPSRPAYPGYQ